MVAGFSTAEHLEVFMVEKPLVPLPLFDTPVSSWTFGEYSSCREGESDPHLRCLFRDPFFFRITEHFAALLSEYVNDVLLICLQYTLITYILSRGKFRSCEKDRSLITNVNSVR